MVEINVLVPIDKGKEILRLVDEDFKIIHRANSDKMNYYIAEVSEEKLTYLTLLYGSKAVWRR